jgi:hypothetical protein
VLPVELSFTVPEATVLSVPQSNVVPDRKAWFDAFAYFQATVYLRGQLVTDEVIENNWAKLTTTSELPLAEFATTMPFSMPVALATTSVPAGETELGSQEFFEITIVLVLVQELVPKVSYQVNEMTCVPNLVSSVVSVNAIALVAALYVANPVSSVGMVTVTYYTQSPVDAVLA